MCVMCQHKSVSQFLCVNSEILHIRVHVSLEVECKNKIRFRDVTSD